MNVTTQLPAFSVLNFAPDFVHTFLDDFAADIDTLAFGEVIFMPTCFASVLAEYFFLKPIVLAARPVSAT
ncbi:unannotated protein [freshwater metagenome]|uniref:Unannotated protein n=1 Tax=freshwater metagenome TaxID=449393 RepID=A0A6J6LF77_9ZZZZ